MTYELFPVIPMIAPSCKHLQHIEIKCGVLIRNIKILGRCPDVSSISSVRRSREAEKSGEQTVCPDALWFLPPGTGAAWGPQVGAVGGGGSVLFYCFILIYSPHTAMCTQTTSGSG